MAGALAELARYALRHDFRSINPADARILLIEGRSRLLEAFAEDLSKKTSRTLERIGDMAHFALEGGPPLPGLAPVAMQQGRYVAKVVTARANGSAAPPPFYYHDRGNMAVIGRSAAVADLGWTRLSGFLAWCA